MKISLLIAAALLFITPCTTVSAQTDADREAVKQAVLDYVEGIYQNDPARVERSVHPKLAKIGFYRPPTDDAYRPGSNMTFERLIEVAKNYNKDGKMPKNGRKDIVIHEVLDQTASVKLGAEWGVDYMHLAKFDGKWLIINVLWQSYPKKAVAQNK
jgi:hypothetical protein